MIMELVLLPFQLQFQNTTKITKIMIFNASWPNQLKAKAEQKKLTTEPYNESLDKFLIRMLMSPKLFP